VTEKTYKELYNKPEGTNQYTTKDTELKNMKDGVKGDEGEGWRG
jgi:hypothetical protein